MHPVRNMCAKFKADCSSRPGTGACQVFNTQKPLPSKIPVTMKIPLNIFSDQINICQISVDIYASRAFSRHWGHGGNIWGTIVKKGHFVCLSCINKCHF